MTTSDWLPGAIVGGVTGLGGWITAWLQRPAAAERAAEARVRAERVLTHQRQLISNGRDLVANSRHTNKPPGDVANERAFADIRPHLKPEVLAIYKPAPWRSTYTTPGPYDPPPSELFDHAELSAELDRLERAWKIT